MTSYYDAYTQRWHDYLDIVTACQAKGAVTIHNNPESLLMLSGTQTVDLLLAWYGEENF